MNDIERTRQNFKAMNIKFSFDAYTPSIPLNGFTGLKYNQVISIEAENGLDGYFSCFHFLDGKFIGHSVGV